MRLFFAALALCCGVAAYAAEDDLSPASTEQTLLRLEAKLDRLEALLRLIYGLRIRRAEAIAADPRLASAIAAVEERYGLYGVGEALTADGTAALAELVKRLAQVASARGPATFAADRDVQTLLEAVASRPDFASEHAHNIVWPVSCGDVQALRTLIEVLLASGSPCAREAALWAALRLPRLADPLGARLAELAKVESPQLRALALAAAAVQGNAEALRALEELLRGRELPGAWTFRLAGELRSAGTPLAFKVYLGLLLDEQYSFAAAQAFLRIDGFDRRIGWRESREERDKLYKEFSDWLERNWRALRFDAEKGRFTVGPSPATK